MNIDDLNKDDIDYKEYSESQIDGAFITVSIAIIAVVITLIIKSCT